MEAANEVPGPGARCEESTDAALAGSDPTRRARGAHKGRHCPAQPRHDWQGPPGHLPGAVPRAMEQPASGPGPPAALRQHPHGHVSRGTAGYPGPMKT